MDYPRESQKCEAMFYKWIETSAAVTWDQLIKALKAVNLGYLVEDIPVLIYKRHEKKPDEQCAASGESLISCMFADAHMKLYFFVM